MSVEKKDYSFTFMRTWRLRLLSSALKPKFEAIVESPPRCMRHIQAKVQNIGRPSDIRGEELIN